MWGWVRVSVVVAMLASGCSLSRGALGTARDVGTRDGGEMDAPRPDDVGIDAPELDADRDAGVDADIDAFVPPVDVGTDVFSPDTGPMLPLVGGLTLVLDERGQRTSAGQVTGWADQSPMGHDFSQIVVARQPTIATVSGWDAVSFSGTTDIVGPAWSTMIGTNGGHLWMVVDNTGATLGADGMPADEDALISSNGSGGINLSWTASGLRGYAFDGAQCVTARQAVSPGLHLIDIGYDGAELSIRVDAAAPSTAPCIGPLTAFGVDARIGGNYDVSHRFAGRVASVIAIDRIPTATEQQMIRDYLGVKYAVAH